MRNHDDNDFIKVEIEGIILGIVEQFKQCEADSNIPIFNIDVDEPNYIDYDNDVDTERPIKITVSRGEAVNYISELMKSMSQVLDEHKNLYTQSDNPHFEAVRRPVRKEILAKISKLESQMDKYSVYDSPHWMLRDLSQFKKDIILILTRYKNVPLINELLTDHSSVIIVGKNGAGKSSLLQDIKSDITNSIVAIPAHKYLFEDTFNSSMKIKSDSLIDELSSLVIKNRDARYSDNNIFSDLLDYVRREHQSKKSDMPQSEPSILDKINEIYNSLFPDIKFVTESIESKIMVSNSKESVTYTINELSDGERSALYFIMNCVLAKEQSIIIVDEPETHLHISLCNQLWDSILKECKDCKFIFISHNPDFVEARNNSRVVWCKKYISPLSEENELVPVDNVSGDTKKLYIELLGSKKPMLLCEGTESSLDFKIFHSLYSDLYTVKPVGGHLNVINHVKALREISDEKIYGIVDRDCHSDDEIISYKQHNISVLPVNEIEMLIMYEPIVQEVLKTNSETTFEDVKERFIEYNKAQIDRLVAAQLKYWVEHTVYIQDSKKAEAIIGEAKKLSDILSGSDKKRQAIELDVRQVLDNGIYEEVLKLCSLKEVVKNTEIVGIPRYSDLALYFIKEKESIREFLLEKINISAG
ncbi:AAA family ATPase [Abiotrophia defectiva]|uniref:AAA family ATPase n=1 Tax=Abiotrophia defectiva TaxID=46125 RepID=UPI0028EF73BD|nr:AAA family ATPase [Abiotrophia defectiva]